MNLFEQFRQAEERVSKTWGEFKLFGLFEREDIPGKYDVVVSASRLGNNRDSLIEIADMFGGAIMEGYLNGTASDEKWWTNIGKFVILPVDDPFVKAVLAQMPNDFVQHEIHILSNFLYDGEIIRSAAVITAQKHPVGVMTAVAA